MQGKTNSSKEPSAPDVRRDEVINFHHVSKKEKRKQKHNVSSCVGCRYVLVESTDDDSWYGTKILPGTVEESAANQHYLQCCKVVYKPTF